MNPSQLSTVQPLQFSDAQFNIAHMLRVVYLLIRGGVGIGIGIEIN